MKTILVLTDFSINADYAAHYALKLAQRIEANLLLCNIYDLPQHEKTTGKNTWPRETNEANSIEDLGELLARLKTVIDTGENGIFRPEINQYSHEGSVADRINDIARNNNVLMAVISSHNAGWLSTMLSGNHSRDIIEMADFPVMLIAYQARFKDYRTIAFATEMNFTDINVLESLTGLAKYMESRILVTQVENTVLDEKDEENSLRQFFNQLPGKINYPGILYHVIKNQNIAGSLAWLTAQINIDLLVLVHRRRSFFQKLFAESITQKLAGVLNKPLLVFPCSTVKETLTVF